MERIGVGAVLVAACVAGGEARASEPAKDWRLGLGVDLPGAQARHDFVERSTGTPFSKPGLRLWGERRLAGATWLTTSVAGGYSKGVQAESLRYETRTRGRFGVGLRQALNPDGRARVSFASMLGAHVDRSRLDGHTHCSGGLGALGGLADTTQPIGGLAGGPVTCFTDPTTSIARYGLSGTVGLTLDVDIAAGLGVRFATPLARLQYEHASVDGQTDVDSLFGELVVEPRVGLHYAF